MKAQAAGVPALILGSGITALGVMRTLGRAGVPLLVASSRPQEIRHSRWYRAAPGWGRGSAPGELAGYLSSGRLERAVLFPCSDHAAMEVARLPSGFLERFPSYLPPLHALETLTDKSCLYRLLPSVGVPCPRTILDPSPADLADFPLGASAPVFLKPFDSQAFFRRFKVKGMWLRGAPQDWPGAVHDLLGEGGILLQEYVPGPPDRHYFIDGFAREGGGVRSSLARRRLRMFPTDFGNSSFMVTVPRDEVREAEEALRRLLVALDYRGIFSAEFKRDERDGVFRLLEVNARAWWFIDFAARCGMDVATMAYRAALGEEVGGEDGYQVGRRMIHPYYDFFACLRHPGGAVAGLGRFLGGLVGSDQPIFDWADPLPGLAAAASIATRLVRHRMGGPGHPSPASQGA